MGFAGVFAAVSNAFNLHCHPNDSCGLGVVGTRNHVSCGLVSIVTWAVKLAARHVPSIDNISPISFMFDILNISWYHNYVYVTIMAIMIAVLMTYHDCSMFNLWFDHCPNCLRQLFSDSKHLQIFQMSLVLMGAKLKFNGVGIESISGQLEQQQIACLVSANILKRFFWEYWTPSACRLLVFCHWPQAQQWRSFDWISLESRV